MATMNYSNYPLKDIPEPHNHDVLCGRGGGTNNHIGNSHWRMLVAANKQLYITLPKRQKMLLSRSIVNAVRSQNPPGRFLQKDSKTNKWFDVGDQRAQEKTSQALREGAPDLKKKVVAKVKTEDDNTETAEENPTETATAEKSSTSNPELSKPIQPESPKQQAPQVTPTSSANNSMPYGGMPNIGAFSAGMAGSIPQTYYPTPQMIHAQMAQMNQAQPTQGVMLYAGPNLQPVQVFPTMVMNEHGMMVPGMSMMPAGMMPSPQTSIPNAQQQQQATATPDLSSNGFAGSLPVSHQNSATSGKVEVGHQKVLEIQNTKTPDFDEYVAAPPPEGYDGGVFSFGSSMMPDAEMMKLQGNGTFGSIMSYKYDKDTSKRDGHDAAPPAPGALEPTGVSFGDVSMMSVGTNRLEATGTSFGTMMSIGTHMPDGGLEAIGTSFGSLSLDPFNRDQLFQALELTGGGAEIPPMFDVEAKATGNLLDCSDTESEGSLEKPGLVAQKSEAWERMKASVAQTQLLYSKSKDSINSNELMPPPVSKARNEVPPVASATIERDFSQLSAWGDTGGHEDKAAAPPPALQKQGCEDDEALIGSLSEKQQS